MQQMQEVAADRIIVRLHRDAAARATEVIPVREHRAQRCDQLVGNIARAARAMRGRLGQGTAHRRDAGAQHVHGMRGWRQDFQCAAHRARQPAQRFELRLVAGQGCHVRQFTMDQQVGDFFKQGLARQVLNVIAAIVQIIARLTHGAQRRGTGGNSRQGDGLLRAQCGCGLAH
jgi:hypothetical protein